MLLKLLSDAFHFASDRYPAVKPSGICDPGKLCYMTFEVCDPAIAEKLADWRIRAQEARHAIEDYIADTFPSRLCATKTLYRLDEQGHIRDVAYNGYVPPGWTTGPEQENRTHHWVFPCDPQEIQKIMRLPASPSHREIAELVKWPHFDSHVKSKARSALIESVNRCLRIEDSNGRMLVHLPHPAHFKELMPIVVPMLDWTPPPYLKPVALQKLRGLQACL